jgi:hypothetical protein
MLEEVGQDAKGLGLEPDGRAGVTQLIALFIQLAVTKGIDHHAYSGATGSPYMERVNTPRVPYAAHAPGQPGRHPASLAG